MSVYKLFGSVSSSTDSVANLDIQFDGHIVAWALSGHTILADALGDGFSWEVSFLSSSTFISNDARGVIAYGTWRQNFLTTGGGGTNLNLTLSGLSIPVGAGERIHLHSNIIGGITCVGNCLLYVEDGADPTLRRRR